jgi:hypothetical protein
MAGIMLGVAAVTGGCRLDFDDVAMVDPFANLGPWSSPQKVPGASSSSKAEENCTMSSDETEMIFTIDGHLYVMTRPTPADAWSSPQELAVLNSTAQDTAPRLTPDDLTLYFASDRPSGGDMDVWISTRTALGQPWASPSKVDEVSTPKLEKWLAPCAGGRYLMVRDASGNGTQLMEGVLGAGGPSFVAGLAGGGYNSSTYVTPDCLSVYWTSDRGGPSADLYTSRRATLTSPWATPVALDELDSPSDDEDPWLSRDGRVMIFSSTRSGTWDVYLVTR